MKQGQRYDVVLMDVDNTLLDFDAAEERALRRTLLFYGYADTMETRTVYYRINQSLWRAFERGEITQDRLLSERFRGFQTEIGGAHDPHAMNLHYMTELSACSFLFPGAETFCKTLAPHCTLAIVTNGVAMVQHGRIDTSPIRPLFRDVFISAELGHRKPSPAFFEAVFEVLPPLDRRRTVIFGDGLSSDIQGGINAGIDSIWYNPSRKSPTDIRPTFEVDGYERAAALILGEVEQV